MVVVLLLLLLRLLLVMLLLVMGERVDALNQGRELEWVGLGHCGSVAQSLLNEKASVIGWKARSLVYPVPRNRKVWRSNQVVCILVNVYTV